MTNTVEWTEPETQFANTPFGDCFTCRELKRNMHGLYECPLNRFRTNCFILRIARERLTREDEKVIL